MLPFDKVVWVLVSSRIQVQLQIILDPDCLPDYLSVFYDCEIIISPLVHFSKEICFG